MQKKIVIVSCINILHTPNISKGNNESHRNMLQHLLYYDFHCSITCPLHFGCVRPSKALVTTTEPQVTDRLASAGGRGNNKHLSNALVSAYKTY